MARQDERHEARWQRRTACSLFRPRRRMTSMAFDEKTVPADVLQDMLSGPIGRRLGWRIRMAPSEWIVDDETGNFLYATFWGDEDHRTSSAYVFSWQRELI